MSLKAVLQKSHGPAEQLSCRIAIDLHMRQLVMTLQRRAVAELRSRA